MFLATHGILRSGSAEVIPYSNTKSIYLDGINDYADVGTTSLGITNAISVSAWVKIPTTNTGGGGSNIQEIICEDATSGSNRNWALNWRGGGHKKWQWVIWNTNGSATVVTSTGLTPNDNQWHHLFATYDGTSNANGLKLYVDGGTPFTATASSTGIRSSSFVATTIGGTSGNGALLLNGTIDEPAIWNSDQSANASSIYNSGTPSDLNLLSNPPLSWWRCGDLDTAPTLTDRGSGGNDATMQNFTTFSTDVP